MRDLFEMDKIPALSDRPSAAQQRLDATDAKLTATQFRMLRRVRDEGMSMSTLRRERADSIAAQIRTLRGLAQLELVIETQGDGGDVRFEITDAGRSLARSDGAR